MSRPSITRLPNWMHSRCLFFIQSRTLGKAATCEVADVDFGGANFLVGIIAIHQQMHLAIDAFERGFPFLAERADGFGVVDIHFLLQTMPGERAIHRAGIDVSVAKRFGDAFGVGALAAGAGAVDGDDDGVTHSLFLLLLINPNLNPSVQTPIKIKSRITIKNRFQSANNSSCDNVRPVFPSRIFAPRPCGGNAASFWKKFGKRFFHARRILDFYSGNFQSQNRKTHRHAMIVVGFDFRAVKFRGINRQRVAFFDDFCAAFGEFRSQGDNAFAFLDAKAAEIGESNCKIAKGARTIASSCCRPSQHARNWYLFFE